MIYSDFAGLFRKSQGIEGVIRRKRVTLTSAQILALYTTPVEIIAAPGTGYYNDVLSVMAINDYNSVAYTGANALELRYTNASGAKVTGDLAAAFINSASDRADKAVGVAVTAVSNAAVVAAVPTANPGAGNGTITLDIQYRTLPFAVTL